MNASGFLVIEIITGCERENLLAAVLNTCAPLTILHLTLSDGVNIDVNLFLLNYTIEEIKK